MSKPALKAVTGRTRCRQRLAAAITQSKAAQDEVARLAAAVKAAEDAVGVAVQDHQHAVEDIASARETQAKLHEAAIEQGHPPSRDDSVQEAQRRASEREEDVETARASLRSIAQKLATAKATAAEARDGVSQSARAVLTDEIEPFFRETKRMQTELRIRRLALGLAVSSRPANEYVTHPIWREIENFTMTMVPVEHYISRYSYPELAQWQEALTALHLDADAPLPTSAA